MWSGRSIRRRKRAALLLLGEVQEELHDPEAVLGEVALPVVDRAVAPLPDARCFARLGQLLALEVLGMHADDEHLLVVGAVEDADLAARRQAARCSATGSRGRAPPAEGTLKLCTATPCGLTPLITWRIVPSLPAASSAWSTTSTPQRVLSGQPRLVLGEQAHPLGEQPDPVLLLLDARLERRDRSPSRAVTFDPGFTRNGAMNRAIRLVMSSAIVSSCVGRSSFARCA